MEPQQTNSQEEQANGNNGKPIPMAPPAQTPSKTPPANVKIQMSPTPVGGKVMSCNVSGMKGSCQITCPGCRAEVLTRVESSMSVIAIVIIIISIFFLIFFFPFFFLICVLFCIPVNDYKHFCPQCGTYIGNA